MIFSFISFLMKFDPKDNKSRHSRSSASLLFSSLLRIVLSLELMIVIFGATSLPVLLFSVFWSSLLYY